MAATSPTAVAKQRLGNARRDDGEAGVLRLGDSRKKLCMMPHTVPNKPMKGAIDPTVAKERPAADAAQFLTSPAGALVRSRRC